MSELESQKIDWKKIVKEMSQVWDTYKLEQDEVLRCLCLAIDGVLRMGLVAGVSHESIKDLLDSVTTSLQTNVRKALEEEDTIKKQKGETNE